MSTMNVYHSHKAKAGCMLRTATKASKRQAVHVDVRSQH